MYSTETKEFDKPNIQSDTDKLNKRISYTFLFLLIFAITISTVFNIAINSPKDKSNDLFSFAWDLLGHGVIDGSGSFAV